MSAPQRQLIAGVCAAVLLGVAAPVFAHSGPPFPIVSTRAFGPYEVSVWTDPDTTDNGRPAGRFWITVKPAGVDAAPPPGTRVHVTIAPADRTGATHEADAAAAANDARQYFLALLMDHEGPFTVHVTLDGPRGHADIDSSVQATYDLRPAPLLILVFILPFALAGFLWTKLLLRRRHVPPRSKAAPSGGHSPGPDRH